PGCGSRHDRPEQSRPAVHDGLPTLEPDRLLPADRARHRVVRCARPRVRPAHRAHQPAAHSVAKGGARPMIANVFHWLTNTAHWRDSQGFTGIATHLKTHMSYSFLAVAIALLLALP